MVNKNQEPRRNPADEVPLSDVQRYFLGALIQESPQHGYVLIKRVRRLSEGVIDPGMGNTYTALRRWVDRGLIEVQSTTERKKRESAMYAITDYGKEAFDEDLKFVNRTAIILSKIKRDNP